MSRICRVVTAVFCILLAVCRCASALNPSLDVSQYAHTAWKNRDGFLNGSITAVAQTPDGYLWIGTEFGLFRFDGVRTVPWEATARQPGRGVRHLLTARDGTLWIAGSPGLASWRDGRLTEYPSFADIFFSNVLEDRAGRIWVGQNSPQAARICVVDRGDARCADAATEGSTIATLFEDSEGSLWAGLVRGVARLKPGPERLFPLPAQQYSYQALAEESGALLVSLPEGLARVVDGKTELAYPSPSQLRPFTATALLRDRDGGLWMATPGRGLAHVHHGTTDVFTAADGLSGDFVSALFEDREGSIWVATTAGLDRFRDLVVPTYGTAQGLSNGSITAVLAATDRCVWIGTYDGLNRWDREQVTIYREEHRPTPSGVREIVGRGLPDRGSHAMFQDSRGRIWISDRRGAGYLEPDRFVAISGVPGANVSSIVEDSRGDLWIAATAGLAHLQHDAVVGEIPWSTLSTRGKAFPVIADPVRGGLWLGFFSGGIAYFGDGRVQATYTAADGLGRGFVNRLRADPDGTIWASTEGGLSRVKDGRIATLSSRNGLPCDAVQWSIVDDSGSVWLGMACALVRIDRADIEAWPATATIHPTAFDSADGIRLRANAETYNPQAAKAADGRIWFSTNDGVAVIDPRHLRVNALAPPVAIEQVTADRTSYGTTAALRLPPLVRDLQIDYTALSLVAPEKNRFKIKLEGWDRDWQDVGTRRQAFYNNLPPRNYRFRVIASNNSGVWNEAGASLDVSIAAAYYQTAWFRTLAVVMVLSSLWAAYRIRLRVIERHEAEITTLNERLMKAQEQERMRIAGELHDGVMQQITGLGLMLGTVRRQIPEDSKAKAAIGDVQRRLIQVGTEVRQLSHDLHPAILKDGGLPEALRGYCDEFSRLHGIPVTCEADDSVRDLSRGAALALFRIAQESLGNAARHGAAQRATVRLERFNGRVVLSVSDDGRGFDTSRMGASSGLGLINMRERARQLNGTFEITSEPGRGTTVRVEIPFRRSANAPA